MIVDLEDFYPSDGTDHHSKDSNLIRSTDPPVDGHYDTFLKNEILPLT